MAKDEKRRAIPRGQHYVPAMYLRGFTNAKGQLYALDTAKSEPFRPPPEGVAKQRDFNMLDIEGIPKEALEQEYGKMEGEIAPGIQRVGADASFGKDDVDRADLMNLVTLLWVRNPRKRKELDVRASALMHSKLEQALSSKETWEAAVEKMKADGFWEKDKPADYEGTKKEFESGGRVRTTRQFAIDSELDRFDPMYARFDKLRWRILKAGPDTGGFVTTDHPVCMGRPHDIDRANLIAPGYSLGSDVCLVPVSSKVALIGRREGEEDVIEVGKHCVASFNSNAIGYAKSQVYSADDQYYYTRAYPNGLGRGFTLLSDPNFRPRE
jgi:hypothetical protein